MNKNRAKYLLSLLVILIIAIPLVRAGGDVPPKSIGPSKGSLIIVGGGKLGPEIVNRFIELAGGAQANFVVIPTAIGDQVDVDREKNRFFNAFGVKNFVVLHTRDRNQADSKEFTEPLRRLQTRLRVFSSWRPDDRFWHIASFAAVQHIVRFLRFC